MTRFLIGMIKLLIGMGICFAAYLGISALLVRYGINSSVNDEEYIWPV